VEVPGAGRGRVCLAAWPSGTKAVAAGQLSGVRRPQHERSLQMVQSRRWGRSRYVALLVVLALHLAIVAALLFTLRPGQIAVSQNNPIELVYIPPASVPKIRTENVHPKPLKGDTSLSIEPLMLGSIGTSQAPSASASNGDGSGVDWKAEARRAVQAFEIRKHEPESSDLVSGSPAEDQWWPRSRHNAGDQYKTANGDWVVWISPSCYQIAVAGTSPYAGATGPQTVCPGKPGMPHEEPAPQAPKSTEKPHQ
jgi:hypothetical protein